MSINLQKKRKDINNLIKKRKDINNLIKKYYITSKSLSYSR